MRPPCPACGSSVSGDARFCQACGVALPVFAAPGSATEEPGERPGAVTAERRQLTVVFCDLVGSTAISERLDPEEVREVMHAYHQACADVIRHYEGHVAQFLGDGVLTYFGYPHAHEDAAVRAVRAGLDIVESIGAVRFDGMALDGPLRVRIGIHTGLVVVGEQGAAGTAVPLAFGGAPNVAARVQNIALPGTVVVSEMTHHLIRPFFEFRPMGARDLKGVAAPLQMYEVLGESGVQTRFDASVRGGLIPLVGRRRTLEDLGGYWESARHGEGRVVLLSGDAGIGKSRMLRAVHERLEGEEHASIAVRCSQQHQNSAFHPLLDYFQRTLQLGRDDSPADKLDKLTDALSAYETRSSETLPLIASLLSLPHPEGAPPLALTPLTQKLRTLEALVGWILDTASRQPTLLELEDLHWSDPSTLELVDLLVERCASERVYFIMTTRDKAQVERWAGQPHFRHLALDRLDPADVAELVSAVAGSKAIPRLVARQIVSRTDGVPLFVEELTKMVLESIEAREDDEGDSATQDLADLAIPATLRDSLMARLDQQPSARQVAQLGATLGREFPLELLRAISPLDDETLEAGLATLVEAELLQTEGVEGERSYAFRHALIRDIAYESLLKRKRQQFHQWTAQVLEKEFPEVVQTQPEILAHHFAAAGSRDPAIGYLQSATQRALGQSAYAEAVHYLSRALELLTHLPASDERSARELELRSLLGVALTATEGYTSENAARNYSRAEEICREIDDAPQLFPSLYGLWTYHMLRNHRDQTLELAARLEQIAQAPEQRYIAASARGVTLYWSADRVACEQQLQRASELFDPTFQEQLHELLGDDAPLLAPLYRCWCLGDLGRFDEARSTLDSMRADDPHAVSPYVRTTLLVFDSILHLNMGTLEAARDLAQQVIALANEQQFPWFLATGHCTYGATLIRDGSPKDGVPFIEQGLAAFEAIGAVTPLPFWLCELARGRLALGEPDDAIAIVDRGLDDCATGLARASAADLHTVRGECRLAYPGEAASARHSLDRAIELARAQGSPVYELRATRALARLLASQGRDEEARDRLASVRAGFGPTEDVGELQLTDQLLAELG